MINRMLKAIRRDPVAWVALFLALGGTSAAATRYVITSTKQIKPSVLKKLHGARGPAGPAGTPGPQGPPGPSASVYQLSLRRLSTVTGPSVTVAPGAVQSAIAVCPSGTRAISGGGSGGITDINISEMQASHLGWFIVVVNRFPIKVQIHAQVQCSGSGQAVAASASPQVRARDLKEAGAAAARLRRELEASGRQASGTSPPARR
jgi:hypothetical protein